MKRYKSYLFRLLAGIMGGLLLSSFGVKLGNPQTNVLFTVYGILFSVFASFSASFSIRNIRRPQTKEKAMSELKGIANGAVFDFITLSVLYSVLVGLPSKSYDFNIKGLRLSVNIDTIFYTMVLLFSCIMAFRFLKLRNLKEKLDKYD